MEENKPQPQDENPLFKILQKAEELMQEQERNNAQNAEISQEIANLVGRIEQLPNDIKGTQRRSLDFIQRAGNHIADEIKSAGNETVQKIENATKNVKGVELELNEADKKSIQSVKDNFSLFKTLTYIFGAMFLLSALTLLGSGYFAKKWYDTSVQTKQEVRAELIEEIRTKGDIITSEAYLRALENEKKMIGGWEKANPEDSKSYNTHRKAIMNLEDNAKSVFFTTPAEENIQQGGEKGFFD